MPLTAQSKPLAMIGSKLKKICPGVVPTLVCSLREECRGHGSDRSEKRSLPSVAGWWLRRCGRKLPLRLPFEL